MIIPVAQYRAGNSDFGRHPTFEAKCNCASMNSTAWVSSPIQKEFCFSECRDKHISPSISSLISSWNPFAVGGFVVPVIFLSFKAHANRWLSHIREKMFKGLPSFAYGYTTATIVLVCMVIGVFTSLAHRTPSPVNLGSCAWPSMAVFSSELSLRCNIRLKAPTASSMTVKKPVSSYEGFISALALTNPSPSFPIEFSVKGCKPYESFTCQVHSEKRSIYREQNQLGA